MTDGWWVLVLVGFFVLAVCGVDWAGFVFAGLAVILMGKS